MNGQDLVGKVCTHIPEAVGNQERVSGTMGEGEKDRFNLKFSHGKLYKSLYFKCDSK